MKYPLISNSRLEYPLYEEELYIYYLKDNNLTHSMLWPKGL